MATTALTLNFTKLLPMRLLEIKIYMTFFSRKKLAKALRFRTYSSSILDSNPAALTTSFLKDPTYKENK